MAGGPDIQKSAPTQSDSAESPHRLEQQRRANRDAIGALGVNPYGSRTDHLVTLADARRIYDAEADAEFQSAVRARKESAGAAGGVATAV